MTNWTQLAVDTVRDPKSAADRIMGWDLDRATLYMALCAVAAINAILASGPVILTGQSVDDVAREALPILALLERPILLFVLIAGGLVVMVQGLFWAGRAMGGQGDMSDLLALLVWLQALRAVAQAAILVLSFAVPTLAGLAALGVMILAFWLMLHFISAALRFDSLLRALGLLIAVVVGVFIGLMLILTLMGVSAGGL
ncbi:Yip1 family protein [uncultured Tateyamaria sp.]|uniref:Yip1 family protein n=1 Tax=uncultured Tateyamaria sp. TaxID=455651 RepID=UPI00262698C6|nr:Yip1 family protein [uncultured Tateyamaria sp.]